MVFGLSFEMTPKLQRDHRTKRIIRLHIEKEVTTFALNGAPKALSIESRSLWTAPVNYGTDSRPTKVIALGYQSHGNTGRQDGSEFRDMRG